MSPTGPEKRKNAGGVTAPGVSFLVHLPLSHPFQEPSTFM